MPNDAFPHFPLRKNRTHEVCGPGALVFACALTAHGKGPVFWVCESWKTDHINPPGFSSFFDPKRLFLARTKDQLEMLAVAEEALRSGVVPLVVLELSTPLSLLAGRRLQLAAEAGKSTGLCMIPQGMGSNSAETRWQCAPIFDQGDSTLQRWEIIKNKTGTFAAWDVKWNAEARRIIVVSEAAQQQGSARAAL